MSWYLQHLLKIVVLPILCFSFQKNVENRVLGKTDFEWNAHQWNFEKSRGFKTIIKKIKHCVPNLNKEKQKRKSHAPLEEKQEGN